MCALPPVPDRAALAPDKVNSPPAFRCRAARWLEIVEVHTLCFHIRSVFLYKSGRHVFIKNNFCCMFNRCTRLLCVDLLKVPTARNNMCDKAGFGNNIPQMLISGTVDIKSCPYYSENSLFPLPPVAVFHAGCR